MAAIDYTGTEIGPIRPPSEATSLMLRVTRNCPWNKCKFCTLYKGAQFSIRRREHVLKDIDDIAHFITGLKETEGLAPARRSAALSSLRRSMERPENRAAAESALHWYSYGCTSVFLQDANTLLTKTDDLAAILRHLKETFPQIERITSYARSATALSKSDEDLARLRAEGLDRVHIGMESGADRVLEFMQKGATKQIHVDAGKKIKKAGMELSEYYIIGLGGAEMSDEHARESADALNRIDPDFIRIRTLSVPGRAPLAEDVRAGRFTQINDVRGAEELYTLLEALDVHSSVIANDHIVNLLPEASGKYPEDKEKMLAAVRGFLELSPEEQTIYRVGRRMAYMSRVGDLENADTVAFIKRIIAEEGIDESNIDERLRGLMRKFI
ncbi:MAG: radical SAM protein [Clostridiales Family XIII bacterium]|jgi:histone acetyltransferase (RNA polymerase elongator complex component)|nr:radical SAM protein [Clostridiales Family XIII bacterium]